MKRSGENIEHILYYEKVEQNIALLSFRKNLEHEVQYSKWGEKIQYYFFRIFDNNFFKNILSHVYYLRDIILQKSKETRQYIFAAGIFLSACILYVVISSFFHVTSNTQNTQEASSNMTLAQNELQKASESLKDPDVFYTHISQAKSYLALVKEKNLFIADVQKMSEDISLLEKQSNGVEMYEANSQNVIFNFPKDTTTVKLVSVNKKIYAIHQKSISGPIIQNEEVQEFSFSDLSEGDNFIDAVEFEGDIILLTQLGRVVRF